MKFSNLSYFYDEETGLYYLNSRYYNPQWGRFINADSVLLPEDLFGHNQFAYCGNNPVVYDDPTGHAFDIVFDIISLGFSLNAVLNDPSDGGAWLALGADVLCLAMPFMTGGGTAVRTLNAVDDVIDYARAADRATDAARVANVAADAVTTIGRADDAVDAVRAVDAVGGVCFVSGTPILTANGHTPIEEIRAGDLVWANDPITGETALKEVVRTFINETDELIRLRVNGEEIVCTTEHPFYSPVKGWTAAVNLRAGDILVTVNGKYVVVEQIQHEILESPIKVYNFEVVNFHTYFVGDTGVLAHNMCQLSFETISTGRSIPKSLNEKLALEAAQSSPLSGEIIKTTLNDSRLPSGTMKFQQVFRTLGGNIVIHYDGVPALNIFFDWKFIDN